MAEIKNKWRVEFLETCKICGGKMSNSRYRTFCSKKCRTVSNNRKQAQYNIEWKKAKRLRLKTNACNVDSSGV
jgi:endogenous inhibitor of DNA gyrase (YacG/DUF329 family)